MKKWTPFNTNHLVRVKLTSYGKELMRMMKMKRPLEDDDGWSEWQMDRLIQTFGQHVSPALEPPFETDIEIQISE